MLSRQSARSHDCPLRRWIAVPSHCVISVVRNEIGANERPTLSHKTIGESSRSSRGSGEAAHKFCVIEFESGPLITDRFPGTGCTANASQSTEISSALKLEAFRCFSVSDS